MKIELHPERMCPACMRETKTERSVCPFCGFDYGGYTPLPYHRPLFDISNGRYLIGSVIKEGGFGILYNALDLRYQRRVALKELYIKSILVRRGDYVTLCDNRPQIRQYFQECCNKLQQEGEALQELKEKDGVVRTYDFYMERGTAYLVMEYLPGPDLLGYLKSRDGSVISYQEMYWLFRPLMKSMSEIHSAGIIHRDISPDNLLFVSGRKSIKLIDFGSARFTTKTSHSELRLVKPGYTPREQYAKNYLVGPWMDVYSIAATMYRCLTGRPPKPSPDRISDQDIVRPSSLGVAIPAAAEEVLLKALSLRTTDRYQNMYELYKALKKASREVVAPPTGIDPSITGGSGMGGSGTGGSGTGGSGTGGSGTGGSGTGGSGTGDSGTGDPGNDRDELSRYILLAVFITVLIVVLVIVNIGMN